MTATDYNHIISLLHNDKNIDRLPFQGFAKRKVIVLLLSDELFILLTMVIVSYQMKNTVNHNTIQFVIKISIIKLCILSDCVNTYKKVAG